eukprot:CAMPEP_0172593102 /NCGR_PEP_ID=MMETSP1068-20121228/12289_1 /TAXON_ID=35684 /ORGANISM="Pseudopedinella elastica, Strain CCMP716" /LENGTH=256 /DNA_ID=CAMNT_0013390487 /DNA_START=44 /DNA_END=814 /DNA_ORIENTATION=-
MAATGPSDEAGNFNWLPLESNPGVLNPFVRRLGLPEGWGFADVFGLDEELLMMVPQPCVALMLLFPSDKISQARRREISAKRLEADGGQKRECPDDVYFVQQHDAVGNACGTIAAVHAVANGALQGHFALDEGSVLSKFLAQTDAQDAQTRGWELTKMAELQELSDATAAAGETEGAGTDDAMNSHFICFTNVGGILYELDGRMRGEADGVAFPVAHGPTTAESFLADAAKVIREDFMARDPENMNFNVTALCKLE